MSLSIGSSSDAQSYLQSLLQLGAGSGAASPSAASFADPMLAGPGGSNDPLDPSATSGLLGASSSPFQSDTLSSLLSAQGQGADSSGHDGCAGAASSDGDGDGDGSGSSSSTATQTTVNPDGSTTTTTTYADGSTEVTTTPAATDMASGGNNGANMSGNPSKSGLLNQLGKLQSLLIPAASSLMAVV